MARKKIWVKRMGQSATLVQITDEDVVDDVKDMILRKYANSLGRSFDVPDVSLRIVPREQSQQKAERTLAPEEDISGILDLYYPGGQRVSEALIIEVPRQRTPRPSPRMAAHLQHSVDDGRPVEHGNDYFPLMPAISPGTTPRSIVSHDTQHTQLTSIHPPSIHPHSIAILETGELPALLSPRERRSHHRPRFGRQHTMSPILSSTAGPMDSITSHHPPRTSRARNDAHHFTEIHTDYVPPPPLPPTPPVSEVAPSAAASKTSSPPLDRVTSPHLPKIKNPRKQLSDQQTQVSRAMAHPLMPGALEGIVPPINVLIVEDNIINLKLLEAFVKRLKVRWQTAMNGRDAVTKWRAGGFHLVLMDIQLPIMSGLEATKEIRRLERVNGIGVFAKAEAETQPLAKKNKVNAERDGSITEEVEVDGPSSLDEVDKLDKEELFRCPVIIVALTASSLQSDRHEALAAGCNDFLTKPVSFPWLERKVMEWGCMQALIDYDGWRKWKDFAAQSEDAAKGKEKSMDSVVREKQEKKEVKKAALLAKFG